MNGNYENDLGSYISKLHVIPFSTIGKENGMLLGIKPDKIIIEMENEVINTTNAICGIYSKNLSKNGSYTALIGLDILERRNHKNEFAISAKK